MEKDKIESKTKHLTYFKVENFKCFKEFELNDIGQFNLFLGDNNVGKTNVLEALLIDSNLSQFLHNIASSFVERNLIFTVNSSPEFNFMKLLFNIFLKEDKIKFDLKYSDSKSENYEVNLMEYSDLTQNDLKNVRLAIKSNNNKENGNKGIIKFKVNEKIEIDYIDYSLHFNSYTGYFPFVGMRKSYGDDLILFFSESIQKSKLLTKELVSELQTFIPNLENIEISSGIIQNKNFLIARLKDYDGAIVFPSFGEGTSKLLRILLEISYCKNSRLMIDEIDTGIHFSRFKSFWRTFLKSAKKNNVQLFMTTHNFECLKYLKEVLLEDDMKEFQDLTRSYTLNKLPDSSIKAYNYNFNEFEFALKQGIELRGGN